MSDVSIEVYGVRDALAELRRLSPNARREAVSKVRAAGAGLTTLGKEPYPGFRPLRGWGAGSRGGRLGYVPSRAKGGVRIEVGGRTPRGADAFNIVTLVQKDAGAALYDIAGLRGGTRPGRNGPNPTFVKALDVKYGRAQRGMWRNIGKIRDTAQDGIIKAITEVAASTNRRLV